MHTVGGEDIGRVGVHVEAQRIAQRVAQGGGDRRHREDVRHRHRVAPAAHRVAELPVGPAGGRKAGVVGPTGIERCTSAVLGASKDIGHDSLLRGAQAGGAIARSAAGGHIARQIKSRAAGVGVLYQSVGNAVQRVAFSQNSVGHQPAFGLCEGRFQIVEGCCAGGGDHLVPLLRTPQLSNRSLGQVEAGRVGQEAVVVSRQAGRCHHGMTAAIGAASEVGTVGALVVGSEDQGLGHRGQAAHRLVAVVQPSLRVNAKQRVLRAAVPRVRTEDCKTHLQAVAQQPAAAEGAATIGHRHSTVGAAVALVQEAAVPVARQAHLEADGVGLAIDRADTIVHATDHQAVLAHGLARIVQGARSHRAGGRDGGAGKREAAQGGAAGQGGSLRGRELRQG